MKSETHTIQNIFQDRRQYCVPFYQRSYVWTLGEQWEQLWEDIRGKAEARLMNKKPTPHFLGAIVLEPQARDGLIGVDTFHIIDGQQRLTTLQFVLTSLFFALQRTEQYSLISIVEGCIRNGNQETMRDKAVEVFKVWPTFRDRRNYKLAMTSADINELRARFPAHFTQASELRKIGIDHPPALAAIWFFTHSFVEWINSDNGEASSRAGAVVEAVMRDLKVVSIVLEQDDDAQIIFETLNGRGAQLHATDLIRNYVFMRADREEADSESLYETLWAPFELEYWASEQRRGRMKKPRLEWLMHSSLQAELRDDVDLGRLYYEYRRFSQGKDGALTAEKQLLILSEYAKHYKELIGGTNNSPIARFGRRIAAFDVTTLYPLALLVATLSVPDTEKDEMFNDLVSYLVRRAICGMTPKNYNNIFTSILKQIGKSPTPHALRNSLSALSGEASRWPTDAEFRNACITAPLYAGNLDTPKIRSILIELEASLRAGVRAEERELPNLEALDVDHIMPRSWFNYWQLPDGTEVTREQAEEVYLLQLTGVNLTPRQALIGNRQAKIPTLGNLTLLNLNVNREAQNYEYGRKRDLLIANTNLRLNIPLIAQQTWDEAAITQRSELLANCALALWRGPEERI